jgi:hypothetical protein
MRLWSVRTRLILKALIFHTSTFSAAMKASCGMSTLPIPDSRWRGFREAHALLALT